MTKEEIQSKLEAAEKQLEEIENLKAEIERLKSKLNEVQENEIPELPRFGAGEEYWSVDSELDPCWGKTVLSREINDYNYFYTKKYATIFAAKCREIAMLLHCKWYCDKEIVTDFSDDSVEKWCVWYDHHSNRWTVDCQTTYENTTVYFTTSEAAQKAADWMNAHMIKSE